MCARSNTNVLTLPRTPNHNPRLPQGSNLAISTNDTIQIYDGVSWYVTLSHSFCRSFSCHFLEVRVWTLFSSASDSNLNFMNNLVNVDILDYYRKHTYQTELREAGKKLYNSLPDKTLPTLAKACQNTHIHPFVLEW
jgi:hypothetical protein